MNVPQPSDTDNRNEDSFWVAGVLYVNPNDPHLLVERRSGLGKTFNFAHPAAWWITGGLFGLLALVQLIFFLIFHAVINLILFWVFFVLCILLFIGYRRVCAPKQMS